MDVTSLFDNPTITDAADIKARFDEDPELMREIIDLFLADYPERVAALYAALDRRDAPEVRLQAHSLKGSAGAIGAGQLAAAAAAVESLARCGALDDAAPACVTVEEQLSQIAPLLAALVETTPSGVAAA